jgi:flagellar basal body-associated protein FliL
MIRLIATGIWICLVTVISSYAATLWKTQTTPEAGVEKLFGGLDSVKTAMISVPILSGGAVDGYVLAQFTFTMKSDVLKKMSVKPDVFLLDAAFRTIYGSEAAAMRGSKKQDLQALTSAVKGKVNERFGQQFVEDVLIESFNFVPKSETRNGAELMKTAPDLSPH